MRILGVHSGGSVAYAEYMLKARPGLPKILLFAGARLVTPDDLLLTPVELEPE